MNGRTPPDQRDGESIESRISRGASPAAAVFAALIGTSISLPSRASVPAIGKQAQHSGAALPGAPGDGGAGRDVGEAPRLAAVSGFVAA
jgi:hypothetical protein